MCILRGGVGRRYLARHVGQQSKTDNMKKKLNKHDFGGKHAETYQKECDCGETVEVSTQEDSFPEYYTDVYVRCKCGKSVAFSLPVN